MREKSFPLVWKAPSTRQVSDLGDLELLDELVDARSGEAANLGAFIDIPLAFSERGGEVFAAGRGHGAAV